MVKFIHFLDKINRVITDCTMWIIVPLVAIMLLDVILRYFFSSPTLWGVELSTMIFGVYMIYAGPCSILEKVQVGVDIFSSHWKPRTRAVVNCLTYAFTLSFFFVLIYTSVLYAAESWVMKEISTSAWGQPIYHWKALIPIAFILTVLQTLSEFLRNLWLAVTGEEIL